MLSFKVKTKAEQDTLDLIAARASALAAKYGVKYPLVDALMDITAAHCSGCPLKLDELLKADDGNFAHDVFGIRRHINRLSGELEDCFVPRFSA